MNILVIGNGFDLAHGFPTTYGDFLRFADVFKRYREVCKKEKIEAEELAIGDKRLVLFLFELNKQEHQIYEELEEMLVDNIWIEYFWKIYENRESIKNGWIDFENEISKVTQTIDKINQKIQKCKREERSVPDILLYEKQIFELLGVDVLKLYNEGIGEYKINLLKDLNKLIRGLEIYLACYVGRMTPEVRSVDIENLDIPSLETGQCVAKAMRHCTQRSS